MNIKHELEYFAGTARYYRFNPYSQMVLTDGTRHLAEKAQCFWLFDTVMSAQHEKNVSENNEFIVWRIVVSKDHKCMVEGYRDSQFTKENLLYSEQIPYTDFKELSGLSEFEFYQEGDVILLKSEH
jgi:hypothetical protein